MCRDQEQCPPSPVSGLRRLRPAVAAVAVALLGAGCATPGADVLGEGSGSTQLLDRFSGALDRACEITEAKQLPERTWRELRLVRAEWLVAVLARYGAARIEDFSGDPKADAAMLLSRVNASMEVIQKATAEVPKDPSLFEVYRADLVVALIRTAGSAIRPTLRTTAGFVMKPDLEDGLQLVENFLKDKLYSEAYRESCREYMAAGRQDAGKLKEVRSLVGGHRREQCQKLERLAGLKGAC